MFFEKLSNIADGLDLTLRIKFKDGQYTISVLPDSLEKVQPLILAGTPQEMDEGFIGAIMQPLTDTKKLLTNTEQYISGLQSTIKNKTVAAEKSDNKPSKKAAPSKKSTGSKQEKPKTTAVKKETPAPKEEKPAPPPENKPTPTALELLMQ